MTLPLADWHLACRSSLEKIGYCIKSLILFSELRQPRRTMVNADDVMVQLPALIISMASDSNGEDGYSQPRLVKPWRGPRPAWGPPWGRHRRPSNSPAWQKLSTWRRSGGPGPQTAKKHKGLHFSQFSKVGKRFFSCENWERLRPNLGKIEKKMWNSVKWTLQIVDRWMDGNWLINRSIHICHRDIHA